MFFWQKFLPWQGFDAGGYRGFCVRIRASLLTFLKTTAALSYHESNHR